MQRYSLELKEAIVKRLRSPFNEGVIALSKKEGIPVATLYTWLKRVQGNGNMVSKKGFKVSGLSVESRFTILVETARMSELELSDYCRTKGLYPEQIKEWKQECLSGMGGKIGQTVDKTQAKKDKKIIEQLGKELARKEKALAEAAALLILRKKLHAFYEEGNEDD